MKKCLTIVLSFLLAIPFIPVSPVAAQDPLEAALALFDSAVEGELLVQFDGLNDHTVMQYASNREAAEAMVRLKTDPRVKFVQPNFVYELTALSNDPLADNQNYLQDIDAPQGWDINRSAEDVVVAVIDSGIDMSHPDLTNNLWRNPKELQDDLDNDGNGYIDDMHGYDFVLDRARPEPRVTEDIPENSIGVQHGTIVAGIIGAQGDNNIGIAGVAWKTQIMALRVLGPFGIGTSEDVSDALRYAIDNGADIINLSLVGTDYDDITLSLLERAHDKGIIVVAAAGNRKDDLNEDPTFPICYDHVGPATIIGVGAIDAEFNRASFSNFGNDCVDIVAPGVKPYSTRFVNQTFESREEYAALFSGTSFSAPMVAGTIALMKQLKPDLTPDEALYALQQGSTRLNGVHPAAYGFDYALNVAGALSIVVDNKIDVTQAIEFKQPTIKQVFPEFIVYPRGTFQPTVYRYQFPGPVLQTPLTLGEDALKSGVRMVQESSNKILFWAWKDNSKRIWRYDLNRFAAEVLFTIPAENDQTIGNVAIGNIDADSDIEMIIGSGPNSKPMISVYRSDGVLKYQFQAYGDEVTGGIDVGVIDINGDSILEIAAVPVTETDATVKIFEYTGLTISSFDGISDFGGGATLFIADVDKNGIDEIILGAGPSGGPLTRVYSWDGALMQEFYAGDADDIGGAFVQYFDVDNDQVEEFVFSYKAGHEPVIRIYSSDGLFREEYGVLDPNYREGFGILAL